jgi:hypothetical protein
MLIDLLTKRYGPGQSGSSNEGLYVEWNGSYERKKCRMYLGMRWHAASRQQYGQLEPIYGEARGGFILLNAFNIEVLQGIIPWGLAHIGELQSRLQLQREANTDRIQYFMHSANVWYYGTAQGQLYVFDAETVELECLGPTAEALMKVVDQWERGCGEEKGEDQKKGSG